MSNQVSKYGAANPSKANPWGVIPIKDGRLQPHFQAWHPTRAAAVSYAKKEHGRGYAISRSWFEGEDPNNFQGPA